MIRFDDIKNKKLLYKVKSLVLQARMNYFDGAALKSYSQEGEDMILNRIFATQAKGFYVDVGAHHPKKFSNTYFFYKRGWKGINIDAMPGSMKLFNKIRPRDINLERALSKKKETLTYYIFNEPALNGFSKMLSEQYVAEGGGRYKIISEIQVETATLTEILDGYLPVGQIIDILSVDVEGFEMEVLQSNDWQSYRPKVIVVEALDICLKDIFTNELYKILQSKGYSLYAKAVNTYIFKQI